MVKYSDKRPQFYSQCLTKIAKTHKSINLIIIILPQSAVHKSIDAVVIPVLDIAHKLLVFDGRNPHLLNFIPLGLADLVGLLPLFPSGVGCRDGDEHVHDAKYCQLERDRRSRHIIAIGCE